MNSLSWNLYKNHQELWSTKIPHLDGFKPQLTGSWEKWGNTAGNLYFLAPFLYSSLSICICNSSPSIWEWFFWAQSRSGSRGFPEGDVRPFIVGWVAACAENIFSIFLLWLSHCNTPAVTPDCCCHDAAPAEQPQGSRRQGVSRAVACKELPLRNVCSHLCHPVCQHTEGEGLQELVGTHFLTNPQIFIAVHRVRTFLPALASCQHARHTVCTHFVKIFQNFQRHRYGRPPSLSAQDGMSPDELGSEIGEFLRMTRRKKKHSSPWKKSLF